MNNKQDLTAKIQDSQILDARKDQIFALINDNELTPEIIDQIKDIIQEDIDENMADILSDDQKKEIIDMENEANDGIKAIATEIANDLQFVESEMQELEDTLTSLAPAMDEMNMDSTRKDLEAATE